MKKIIDYSSHTYKKGYVKVGQGHELYYEFYGNPVGKPIVYLHGGPGAGFSENDKRFFDPKVWNVLFFDQRGAGKSKPFATIENNTSQYLIEDIKYLIDYFKLGKICIFGGSWGSTLALLYSINNPETVVGMVIRGIWLGGIREEEKYQMNDIRNIRPLVWQRLIDNVPFDSRDKPLDYYLSQMQSSDPVVREKYSYEWSLYEISLANIKYNKKKIDKIMSEGFYKSMSPIETYYIKNHAFFPLNYILENCHKLKNIPVSIIHGEYDLICPVSSAYKLHALLPKSKFHIVCSGHSSSDPEMEKRLIREVKKFTK